MPRGKRLPREERMKGYRPVEMVRDDRVFDRFASAGVKPIAVELRPDAESLVAFEHPADALYVFGPEDGGHRGAVRPPFEAAPGRAGAGRFVREMLREHRGPV